MGFRTRIDRATDLRNPQSDSVVGEDRRSQAELVAVEGSLRLAYDNGVEVSLLVT
jgi:hypothetical protein